MTPNDELAIAAIADDIARKLAPAINAVLTQYGVNDPELATRFRALQSDVTRLGLLALAGQPVTEPIRLALIARAKNLESAAGFDVALAARTLLLSALEKGISLALGIALA
jgi:hypothetical protein